MILMFLLFSFSFSLGIIDINNQNIKSTQISNVFNEYFPKQDKIIITLLFLSFLLLFSNKIFSFSLTSKQFKVIPFILPLFFIQSYNSSFHDGKLTLDAYNDFYNSFKSNPYYVTSLVINSGIETITSYAFANWGNILNVTLQEGVKTIEQYAFMNCKSMQLIIIPSSINNIIFNAFFGCTNQTSFLVSSNNSDYTNHNNDGVLYSKNLQTLYVYPKRKTEGTFIVPSNVKNIYTYAFSNCSCLETIVWNDAITSIGEHAFYCCTSLKNISLPKSIDKFPKYVCKGCVSLTEIDFDHCKYVSSNSFSQCTALKTINIPNIVHIGSDAFAECTSLETAVMNISEEIAYRAFESCSSLKYVSISGEMKQIFPYAFTDCSSLKEITFPDKLEDIQEGAFLQCTSLETVMIGENVKKIGDNAFKNCSKLHCIYYNGTKEPITGKDSFSGVNTSYIMVLNTYNGSSTIGGLNTYVGIINECVQPTGSPTELPTGLPTGLPTESPTGLPTELPTTTYDPSETNTQQPTAKSEESFPNKSEFLDSNGFKSGAAYSILMVIMTLALIL